MSLTPYIVTIKETPRARKVHTWIRFGKTAELVAEQLRADTRHDMPELTILAVEPTADPRGEKVRQLAEDAAARKERADFARLAAEELRLELDYSGHGDVPMTFEDFKRLVTTARVHKRLHS